MAGSRPQLTAGAVVLVDLGIPAGHEAGFARPVIVVTAQEVLDAEPSVVQVVPITSNRKGFWTDVPVEPGPSGLATHSHAQCQHLRSVSVARISEAIGAVDGVVLRQIREMLGLLLDTPMP